MAFFIPSFQFFFGLPRVLLCFGIHFNAILGNLRLCFMRPVYLYTLQTEFTRKEFIEITLFNFISLYKIKRCHMKSLYDLKIWCFLLKFS
jgi:hypothetical protein